MTTILDFSKDTKPISETKHQIKLVRWADERGIELIHVPNQGWRLGKSGAILKMMGLRAGFPDIMALEARGGYYGLFIELKQERAYTKTEMNTRQWKEQQARIDKLCGNGYFARRAFGFEEAAKLVTQYYNFQPTGTWPNLAQSA